MHNSTMAAQAPTLPLGVDPLIAEAKERARRRRRLLVPGVVLAVAAAIATPLAMRASRNTFDTATHGCGVTAAGTKLLQGGQKVYQEPGYTTHPNAGPPAQVQCSGSSIWAVWNNGAAMMQTAYFGVHSSDGGRTWHPVFAEHFFGRTAPYQLDADWGPWKVRGNAAYFVGYCEACSVGTVSQTVSLYVTKDGGKTFRTYKIPSLTGFIPARIDVSPRSITVVGNRFARGLPAHKTATVRVG